MVKKMEDKQPVIIDEINRDISKPIFNTEQGKKLLEQGEFPVSYITPKIGRGTVKKTEKMKKGRLKSTLELDGNRWFNGMYPEKVIGEIVIEYCNKHPFPKTVLERIKQELEKNIRIKKTDDEDATDNN